MPSPSKLDFEPLLAPIPGPLPEGQRLPLLERNRLKEMREEVDPEKMMVDAEKIEDSNARRLQIEEIRSLKRKKPQWGEIVDFGKKFLAEKGKELHVALAMTEALTILEGFAGLRDGLRLVRRLCDECWDRLYPAIDPDDPESIEARTACFTFLTEADRSPFFPSTVRSVPVLLRVGQTPISTASCQARPGFRAAEPPEISTEEFERAVHAASDVEYARVKVAIEDLEEAKAELEALDRLLDQRAGKVAPSVIGLRKAIDEVLFQQAGIIQIREGVSSGTQQSSSETRSADSPAGNAKSAGSETSFTRSEGRVLAPIASREDAYHRLGELAELLEKFDPHSPVPLLIRRALEMREMRFPELVDALTREVGVMGFLRTPLNS